MGGLYSEPWLGMGKLGSRAGRILIWGSESGQSALCQVPWSGCTPELVLQMSNTSCSDYYLVTADMNSVCQDLYTGYSKSLPSSLSQSNTQWPATTDFHTVLMVQDHSRDSNKVTLNTVKGELDIPPGFSFSVGGTRGSRETSPHGATLA